jgi:LacI family xylobiose transport system transcriptional regulator
MAGLTFDSSLVRAGDFGHEASYAAGLELLQLSNRPTAIFSGNDLQALAVYAAARKLGLRIPQDLSVVGFDDLPLSSWITPSLTTIRQPFTEMAEAATRLVIDISRGANASATRFELATRLVVRKSTAAPLSLNW